VDTNQAFFRKYLLGFKRLVDTNQEFYKIYLLALKRMPMATKFDQRKKIKKLAKHKRNQKNNLAKNFL
jgi:hypothetical protein